MKAMSKIFAALLAAAMLTSFVACGSTTKEVQPAAPAAEEKASPAKVEEPAKKVKIILWEKPFPDSNPAEIAQYELREKRFKEKFPNVEVEYKNWFSNTDYRQEYDKALMAGNAPAVIAQLPYVDVPSRIANKTIADITEYVNGWGLKKENKVWTAFDEALSKDGKWYGVPYNYYLAGITYNVATIKAGGGDPDKLPKTWDEFTAMGQKISDPSKARFGYALMGFDWNAWEFTPWVWSAGGEMVTNNTDGTYKIGFNEEPGVDAAMLWHDTIWKHKMTQKNVLAEFNEFKTEIQSGRCAFGWMVPMDHFPDAKDRFNQKEEDFGVIKIPGKTADKAVTFSGGAVWLFNPKNDKDQMKAAWDYVQMVSYDEQYILEEGKLMAEKGRLIPGACVRTDLVDKYLAMAPWPDRWKKDMAELAKGIVKPEPFCPHWGDLKNAIAKPIQKIILKENITREETKQILDAAADELYKKFPDTFKK